MNVQWRGGSYELDPQNPHHAALAQCIAKYEERDAQRHREARNSLAQRGEIGSAVASVYLLGAVDSLVVCIAAMLRANGFEVTEEQQCLARRPPATSR